MENTARLMTALIKSFLYAEKPNISFSLTKDQAEKLFSLSKKHDVAHLVGNELFKNNIELPSEIKKSFQHAQSVAVYRYEQLRYEQVRIYQCFEREKIDFVPLKGAVIRPLYPEPWLRTSCDVDILVHKEDLDRAIKLLIEMGFENKGATINDVSLQTASGAYVELHFALIDNDVLDKSTELLKDVWQYTSSATENSCQKVLPNELIYYYHIAHIAKHFLIGGCGIKPFIDLYFINKKLVIDVKKKNSLLEKGGLSKFVENVDRLFTVWFEGGEYTELTKKMSKYILSGGVYGSRLNLIAVQYAQHGGAKQYYKSRIFLSYEQLKCQYPKLENRKWLFPFYQVLRWFRLFKKGKVKDCSKEIKTLNNVKDSESVELQQMLKELKLTK